MRRVDQAAVVARLRAAGCVFAEDEARVLVEAARTTPELQRLVDQRVAGTPLEVVVGWAEFCGLRIAVEAGVFVPRRRTEFLVEQALSGSSRPVVIVDLCCGSGAIGLAVMHGLGERAERAERAQGAEADVSASPELYAVDSSDVATRCARRNLGGIGQVRQGDLYQALPEHLRGRVDLLVANAPYVPTGELGHLPAEARLYEPIAALDGGPDGTQPARRIAAGAADWLAPGGRLLIESSRRQAPTVAAALAATGLATTISTDHEREATVVTGRRNAAARLSG